MTSKFMRRTRTVVGLAAAELLLLTAVIANETRRDYKFMIRNGDDISSLLTTDFALRRGDVSSNIKADPISKACESKGQKTVTDVFTINTQPMTAITCEWK
jgi:hypothetical protein